jgi:hypothetical protein
MSEKLSRQCIGCVALLVRSYDEAKNWYCDTLGFTLIEDTPVSGGNRWLLVTSRVNGDSSMACRSGYCRTSKSNREPNWRPSLSISAHGEFMGLLLADEGRRESVSPKNLVRKAAVQLSSLRIFTTIVGTSFSQNTDLNHKAHEVALCRGRMGGSSKVEMINLKGPIEPHFSHPADPEIVALC